MPQSSTEYAHRHRHHYSALLFVSGDTPQRLDSGLAALCEVLPPQDAGALPPEQAARIAAVMHWLTTHGDWLLIVDNVGDEAAARALTAYFDKLHTGHVLITSRLHGFSRQVATLDLSVLSEADATDLLLQLTLDDRRKAADDDVQALALARLMEGLPLALHQAAGYINEQRLTFAQYLARYEQEAADLLRWFSTLSIPYAGPGTGPDALAPRPVLITWKTSFDRLDANAKQWLLVFSHFAPDSIPEFLLEDAPDASAEVKTLHRSALEALAQAEKISLLTRYDAPPPSSSTASSSTSPASQQAQQSAPPRRMQPFNSSPKPASAIRKTYAPGPNGPLSSPKPWPCASTRRMSQRRSG